MGMALTLPMIVLMFGVVRSRQLQSKAHPKWAEIAKATDPQLSPIEFEQIEPAIDGNDFDEKPLMVSSALNENPVSLDVDFTETAEEQSNDGSFVRSASLPVTLVDVPIEPMSKESTHSDSSRRETETEVAGLRIWLQSELSEIRVLLDQLVAKQSTDSTIRDPNAVITGVEVREDSTSAVKIERFEPVESARSHDIAMPAISEIRIPGEETVRSETSAHNFVAKTIENVDQHASALAVPSLEAVSPVETVKKPEAAESVIRIERFEVNSIATYVIDVHNADIRSVFAALSEKSKINIVCSSDVSGQVTIHLKEIRTQAAIRAIAESCGCVCERDSGIVFVRTVDEVNQSKLKRPPRAVHARRKMGLE
jgi:hypothetical protein